MNCPIVLDKKKHVITHNPWKPHGQTQAKHFGLLRENLVVVGWETWLHVEREMGNRKGDGKERERRGEKEQPAWSDQ